MNTKAKGNKWERIVRDNLRHRGFLVANQKASAFPDLVCISSNGAGLIVECKSNGVISPGERQLLIDIARMHKCCVMTAFPRYSPSSNKEHNITYQLLIDASDTDEEWPV